MGKYVQYITYKGRRILFTNAAGLAEAECLVALEEMKQALIKEGEGTPTLADLTGLRNTKALIDKAREADAAVKATGVKYRPSAVVGLSGLQKAVAQMFGKGVHYADTVEEAKEWLVKEYDKHVKR